MLDIKKISRGFQITLPKSFREKFNLDIGDLIEIVEEEGKFILYPLRSSHNPAQKLMAYLDQLGSSIENEDDILELAHQQRSLTRKIHESHH